MGFPPGAIGKIMSEEQKQTVIKTRHGELTLEQLAEVQPGMSRLMKEVGDRYHILYFAAKGGNWKLAHHELKQVIALFRLCAVLRPKYTEDLASFTKEYFDPMSEAIQAKDWKKFEESYNHGIEGSNVYHEKYGYEYIRYILPKNPPEYYELKESPSTKTRATEK